MPAGRVRTVSVVLLVLILEPTGGSRADERPAIPDAAQADNPDATVAPKKEERKAARLKPGRRRAARPAGDGLPACACARRNQPARPPVQSMPDLFQRMAETFMQNPATGFNSVVKELSAMEGPAVEGIVVSPAEERAAGRKARTEYLDKARALGYRTVDDGGRLDYLRALVGRLAKRMTHRDRYPNIEVTLIDAPIPDGQSFPGGFLVFTTALLKEPDEATVAGVVAHELAHLDRGHLYGYVRRSKLAEATYQHPPTANVSFDRLFTQQVALFGLMFNPFRPEHETQADCTAVGWLYQEGYDPRALVGFFEEMHARNKDQPDSPFFSFGRTHPYSLDRRAHVLARYAQLQRWKPRNDLGLYADNLRRLVPKDDAAAK